MGTIYNPVAIVPIIYTLHMGTIDNPVSIYGIKIQNMSMHYIQQNMGIFNLSSE